jgi:hypothetical protein
LKPKIIASKEDYKNWKKRQFILRLQTQAQAFLGSKIIGTLSITNGGTASTITGTTKCCNIPGIHSVIML